jgi:hypothetical protein
VTADSAWRPTIDWISFLEAAPYFTQAITHRSNAGFGLSPEDLGRLAPVVRAADFDERVSELFQRYRPRFEPLERDFFAMNQNLRMRLYRAITSISRMTISISRRSKVCPQPGLRMW